MNHIPQPNNEPYSEVRRRRNELMYSLYMNGDSYKTIATYVGLTVERTRQICLRAVKLAAR